MRIDNECIRGILFTIEETATFETSFLSNGCSRRYPQLEKYTEDMLSYHLRYLKMKNFIYTPDERMSNAFDLTPDGHDFLNSIRNNRI